MQDIDIINPAFIPLELLQASFHRPMHPDKVGILPQNKKSRYKFLYNGTLK